MRPFPTQRKTHRNDRWAFCFDGLLPAPSGVAVHAGQEGVYADAYADCIANLLPILDNLERASGSDNLEAVKKGLEMTAKAFADALDKMGVAEVETKTFDPNLHNAVMHVEDESFGENEIVEVFQKGYAKGDKVIRYAMVKVAN